MTTPPQTLRAPMPYFGGKARIAGAVWERFGNIPNFVEPFFGSGAVLLARPHEPGIETVNDADGFVANFWRAVQADPAAVAHWADWPVNENDMHARHLWLVNEGRAHVERLTVDPDYYDAKVAGWWLWGICQWIGSGWCSGKGPWRHADADDAGKGINVYRQRPHLGPGKGINRQLPSLRNAGMGINRQLPHVGAGVGINRQRPHLAGPGVGINRQLSHPGDAGRGQCAAWSEHLGEMMGRLADRLRRVRVCCGDWSRICGPTPTWVHYRTGVFLDPPYSFNERQVGLYTVDTDVAADVRRWAIANGNNPELRIALCGYVGEHDMPADWEVYRWKAHGGYGSMGEGEARANAEREVIYFSPHCLKPGHRQSTMFDFLGGEEP